MATLRGLLVTTLLGSLMLTPVGPAAGQGGSRRMRPQAAPPASPSSPAPPGAPSSDALTDGNKFELNFSTAQQAVERGEGRAALAFYERVATDGEQRGDRPQAARGHACVLFVAVRLGQLQKAIRAGTRALELLREESTATDEPINLTISVYSNLGAAYRAAGDHEHARRWFEEGLAYAKSVVSPRRRGAALSVVMMLRQLAQTAFAQRDVALARDRAQEAATLAEHFLGALPGGAPDRLRVNGRKIAADSFGLLARAQLALDDKDGAEASVARARQYARLVGLNELDQELTATLAQLALARRDYAGALALYQQALAQAGRLERTGARVGLYQGEARSYAGLGRLDDALASVRRSLELIEEVRGELQESSLRSTFVEDKQGIYQFAVRMALRAGRPEDGFAFAERGRARAFLDLLGNATTLSKGRTRALVREEVELRERVAEARALASDGEDGTRAKDGLDAAERQYRAFLERVRKENVEQASLMTVEPVTLDEIQALLPEGTTLVEYLVGESDVVVWIVERRRVKALQLPTGRAALVADVRALRAAITDQAPVSEIERRARALHDRVLAPARAEIRGDRLVVVPHDVLHYLPFAALRSPNGRWLIEEYAIATLPSASVLKYLAGKGATSGARPLALGNPDVGSALNLRYAEREARMVAETYPGTTVLVRAEASEARVKSLAGGAGLLHFATHAELNEDDPMSSALLLTPGDGEDGRLEVRELFGLDLHARLVVLSACETGLGKLSRGDDLVGLQRAFLYAGTPTVVTTLWKVDDRASFVLMREFYGRLKSVAPGEALSGAQRETLRQFPHPFAWAAYGLTGAPW